MGYVMQFPEEDRLSATKKDLLDRIGVALAGRATEALVFQDVTTGASNDFQQATNIARRMVTMWGMSDAIGHIALKEDNQSYLGDYESRGSYSEETAQIIDQEIKAVIDSQYVRVLKLLEEKRDVLDTIVEVLLERETLHAEEFAMLMRGEPLPEHEPEAVAIPSIKITPPNDDERPLMPPHMMPKPG
jgi:cell division protease FtsH